MFNFWKVGEQKIRNKFNPRPPPLLLHKAQRKTVDKHGELSNNSPRQKEAFK
jgi:hypothetical protein